MNHIRKYFGQYLLTHSRDSEEFMLKGVSFKTICNFNILQFSAMV